MENPVVGEKVKFLDRKGGGVIVAVLDPKTVTVASDDGFEIPVLITELVRIDPTDAGGRFFEEHYKTVSHTSPGKDPRKEEPALQEPNKDLISRAAAGSVYLAYIPHDQKYLTTGYVDVCLINGTASDLLYNLYHRTPLGHFEGVDYGSVFAGTRQLVATVNRENIVKWSDGYLQFLFHAAQSESVPPPFNSEFRIEGKKFLKEGSYRTHPLIEGRGIVVRIFSPEPI